MARLILTIAFAAAIASSSAAATFTLHPLTENTWQLLHRSDLGSGPGLGLDPRQGSRAGVVFDLTGINPQEILGITLSVVAVYDGSYSLAIEALGRSVGSPADPFVWTRTSWSDGLWSTYASEAGPCFTSPSSCPAIDLGGFGVGHPLGSFAPNVLDVTGAKAVLGDGPFLQLNLLGGVNSIVPNEEPPWGTTQLGWSGLEAQDPRLAAPVLTVEVVPEPGSTLLLGLGLAALSAYRCRQVPSDL